MQFVDYPLQESEILYEVPVSRGDDKKIEPPMLRIPKDSFYNNSTERQTVTTGGSLV